ncbi:MAG: hypothetical protein WC322_03815 [Candidatus Paceibacterota bacterium]|jgi:hypothetical protein
MIDLTDTPQDDLADLATSKQIGERLNARFPGYLWAVHCQWQQGIAIVRNLSVSAKYGYVIHILKVWSASEMDRQADKAGGEILERYRLNRAGIDFDQYDAHPVDHAGLLIGDTAR